MTVGYAVSLEVLKRLWDEYEYSPTDHIRFADWMLEVKVPYADSMVRDGDGYHHIITFKEEKDLTLFLLTL